MTQQRAVLHVLRESPGMRYTTQELADILDLPRKNVAVHVAALLAQGLVCSDSVRARGARATYWAPERTSAPDRVTLPGGITLERTPAGWRELDRPGPLLQRDQVKARLLVGVRALNHTLASEAPRVGVRHPSLTPLVEHRNRLVTALANLDDTPMPPPTLTTYPWRTA